jgi:hypothetical protein
MRFKNRTDEEIRNIPFGFLLTKQIAKLLGIHSATVSKMKIRWRRIYKTHPQKCPECRNPVDIETYLDTGNKKKQCRACWCDWNAPITTPERRESPWEVLERN